MGIIDKAQNLALEIIGLILIVIGGLGLINLAVPFIPFLSSEFGLHNYIIILVIGLILSGYKAIPKRIIGIAKSLKKK